ncbi:hypothetical protein EGW08_002786 [Elysia chlorotica]|uniref:Uncharacterized protein n=1 Tax=Elysia chlorotica TaxID=188477 RepID=A0A433U6L6_ELYCH|nr:hypothetical protein EGW08_002786 [Elysia chlorotica]
MGLRYANPKNPLYRIYQLYNFFNTMVEQFSLTGENHGVIMKAFSDSQHRNLSNSPVEVTESDEGMLRSMCDPDLFPVEIAYCGPRLNFPITRQQIRDLISAFKDNQLLHEARRVLRTLPNINRISSSLSGQVTVCGDLHGKLDDLYMIFQKSRELATGKMPFSELTKVAAVCSLLILLPLVDKNKLINMGAQGWSTESGILEFWILAQKSSRVSMEKEQAPGVHRARLTYPSLEFWNSGFSHKRALEYPWRRNKPQACTGLDLLTFVRDFPLRLLKLEEWFGF